jgi:hypothetical protein
MRSRLCAMVLAGLIPLLPDIVDAQRGPRRGPTGGGRGARLPVGALGTRATALGIRGGHDFVVDRWSVDTQLRLPVARRLAFVPSGDVFLGDSATDWQLSADLSVPLRGAYIGGGIGLLRADDRDTSQRETRAVSNLLAGIEPRGLGRSVRPFAEGRWTFASDAARFRLVAGVNVPIWGVAPRRR